MIRFLIYYFIAFLCCFNLALTPGNCQTTPEITIDQHEYSICEGDIARVDIGISGDGPIFIEYEFEGDTFSVFSTSSPITLELFEEGVYTIFRFGNAHETVEGVNELITIALFPAPNVYFTGEGSVCNSENPEPLVAHFEGVAPFIMAYLINGQTDTLYVNDYEHTFPTDQPIQIETRSLADYNCRIDLVVYAQYETINLISPAIYGDTIFCELDTTSYSTDLSDYTAEWYIPAGANYVEGINSEGSFISVTWITSGSHEVRLRVIDAGSQCSSIWSVLAVKVNEKPDAVELIDTTICFESEEYLLINIPVEPGDILTWPELGITGTTAEFYEAGNYSFILENQYGCSDTGTVVIGNNCIPDVHVPEAFTPNGDGINDFLEIFGLYDELELSIYSPSGIELFQMNGGDLPWDGTNNGHEVPAGSYCWYTTFKGRDGIPGKKSGIVTIIR